MIIYLYLLLMAVGAFGLLLWGVRGIGRPDHGWTPADDAALEDLLEGPWL